MCCQTAKEIGAYSTVLFGKVDAILLIGGMPNSKFITDYISKRVEFITPVVILPGEREMEAFCLNAYHAVKGISFEGGRIKYFVHSVKLRITLSATTS